MNTRRLFKENVYLKESEALVKSVTEKEGKLLVTFNQTIFFPVGGGQTCDTGTLSLVEDPKYTFDVTDVYEYGDDIFHVLEPSCDAKLSPILAEGNKVVMNLNWDRRFDNMQRHCGEHILTGAFYEFFGGVNRGFHMGESYMTIDISLEKNPDYKTITWEMAKKAELRTNQIIWENVPMITVHFDKKEDAKDLKLRKDLAIEEDITIVGVEDITKEPYAVACCGTHPAYTGQVGMVKIYKVEANKGMFRIYFEAGKRAFEQYQDRFDILTELERDLSAGYEDILAKYEKKQEKSQEIRDRLFQITAEIIVAESDMIKTAQAENSDVLVKSYENLVIDDLLEIGKSISGNISKIVILVHEPTNTALLFSDEADCGKIIKENAKEFGGRGGGKKTNARAVFAKKEELNSFIDFVKTL